MTGAGSSGSGSGNPSGSGSGDPSGVAGISRDTPTRGGVSRQERATRGGDRPPRNPIKIRDSGPEDWATIWPFFRRIIAVGETYCLPTTMMGGDARALWFGGPRTTVLVAVDTSRREVVGYVGIGSSPIVGQVVGTVTIHPNRDGNGDHVAGASFMVDPDYAGHGVGRALGVAALIRAKAEGYRAMRFDAVVESNTSAVHLWRSLGFEIVGTVPQSFRHPRDGLVGLHVMYREL